MNQVWVESPPGTVPRVLPMIVTRGVLWQANEDELLLNIPAQARFWVQRGHPIRFERVAGVNACTLHLWLQGLPLAAYFVQRFYLALHAAAISTPKGAIVVAGHSAMGKTTLAAALACRGYPLLADEIVPILPAASGALEVAPAMPDLFLWRAALTKLGFAVDSCVMARPGLERYALPLLPVASDPQSIAAIYLLRQSNEDQVSRQMVVGQDRFLDLQHYAFNRLLPELPSIRQKHFMQWTVALARTPIYRLYRPQNLWSVAEIIAIIEQDLGL